MKKREEGEAGRGRGGTPDSLRRLTRKGGAEAARIKSRTKRGPPWRYTDQEWDEGIFFNLKISRIVIIEISVPDEVNKKFLKYNGNAR